MIGDLGQIKNELNLKLVKALNRLEYSFVLIQQLDFDDLKSTKDIPEETLTILDTFSSRFSRVVDIFLSRYLRILCLIEDPGFNGSFKDILNYSAKKKWIDDPNFWYTIRSLRNKQAHEYFENDVIFLVEAMVRDTKKILEIRELINNEIK